MLRACVAWVSWVMDRVYVGLTGRESAHPQRYRLFGDLQDDDWMCDAMARDPPPQRFVRP